MLLHDADHAALAAGANLAMAGDELLQFARAVPLGGRQWGLSGLWRGRRGTEAMIATQSAGDRFVLLDAEALVTLDLPAEAIGKTIQVLAQGVGDVEPGAAEALVSGISVVPPSPVHLRATALPGGGAEIAWTRRSRSGWDWIDGVEAPLAEESELYQVAIVSKGGDRLEQTEAPRIVLTAAERSAAMAITVRQIGAHGLSPAATLILSSLGED
jgi:hypothetical protein